MTIVSLAERRAAAKTKTATTDRIVTIQVMSHITAQGTLLALYDTGLAMIDAGGKRCTRTLISKL